MENHDEVLTGKCSGCSRKAYDDSISMACLGCKRQYYPNMESSPYEKKPDLYNEAVLHV